MAGTPKLIVLSSQFRGKQFELTNDMYTVGRSDERDICIKDSSLSSYHCDIIQFGGIEVLFDADNKEGSRSTTTQKTSTGITISDIDPDSVNLGAAPEQASASDKKERIILVGVISVLLIAVLALAAFLVHRGN